MRSVLHNPASGRGADLERADSTRLRLAVEAQESQSEGTINFEEEENVTKVELLAHRN